MPRSRAWATLIPGLEHGGGEDATAGLQVVLQVGVLKLQQVGGVVRIKRHQGFQGGPVIFVELAPDRGHQVAVGEYAERQRPAGNGQSQPQPGVDPGSVPVEPVESLQQLGGERLGLFRAGASVKLLEPVDHTLDIVHLVHRFFLIGDAGIDRGQHQAEIVGPVMVVRRQHGGIGTGCGRGLGDGNAGSGHGE